MAHERVSIEQVQLNPNNPRSINRVKFRKLKQSIEEFPEMLDKRPLVVDENMILLGGNMRYRALIELGFTEVPIQRATDWTEEQKQAFIIKDNVSFGDWDMDELGNNWDMELLDAWGVPLPFDKDDIEELKNPNNDGSEHPFAIELDRESNYVVLKFSTDIDWIQAKTLFGLQTETARRSNGKPWSSGIGRVVDGPQAIKILQGSGNAG
jgi:hypothetical protein